MKFTLIAFHPLADRLYLGNTLSEFGTKIEEAKGNRVEIARGVYLYETLSDASCIHRLCEVLREEGHTFCMLHFESETSILYGSFGDALATELAKKHALEIANIYTARK